MGKKRRGRRKRTSRKKSKPAAPSEAEAWLDEVARYVMEQRYERAVQAAHRILRRVPEGSEPYGEAYHYLGTALAMLGDYEESYQALSKALEANPRDAMTLYNRALSARFTMRTVQSLRDIEKAVKSASNPQTRQACQEALTSARQLVQKQLEIRGPDFTLDQLIEQQEMFQRGLELMRAERWAEAEQSFRRVIDMADVTPQPWGNVGGCLMMQDRLDEAEQAFKRALEIEPDYDLARRNLDLLSAGYEAEGIGLRKASAGLNVKPGIVFVEE